MNEEQRDNSWEEVYESYGCSLSLDETDVAA